MPWQWWTLPSWRDHKLFKLITVSVYLIVFLLIAPIPPPPLRPSPASLLSLVFFQITSRALAVESRMWSLKDLRRGARWGRAITWASGSPIPEKDSEQPWRHDHSAQLLLLQTSCRGCRLRLCQAAGLRARRARGHGRVPERGQGPGRAASEPCAVRSPALRLALRLGVRRLQAASWKAAKRKLARLPHLERLTNEPTTHSRSSRAAFVAIEMILASCVIQSLD